MCRSRHTRRQSPETTQCAYADFTLSGTVNAGDFVGLSFLTEAYTTSS